MKTTIFSILTSLIFAVGCANEQESYRFEPPKDLSSEMVSEKELQQVGCFFHDGPVVDQPELSCQLFKENYQSYLQFVALKDYLGSLKKKISEIQELEDSGGLGELYNRLILQDKIDQTRRVLEEHLKSSASPTSLEPPDSMGQFYVVLKRAYGMSGLIFEVQGQDLRVSAESKPLEGNGIERVLHMGRMELQRAQVDPNSDPLVVGYYQQWIYWVEQILRLKVEIEMES